MGGGKLLGFSLGCFSKMYLGEGLKKKYLESVE